jgi:hypothetical protein
MFEWLVNLLCISAAVGVVACLISESNLFGPIREYISHPLVYCPICLSFWLAMPSVLWDWRAYFLVIATSNLHILLILYIYESLDRANEDAS